MDPFKQEYVIFRKPKSFGNTPSTMPITGTRGGSSNKESNQPEAIKIEKDEISSKDISKLDKDDSILSYAPSMPMALIRPQESDVTLLANTPAWGLENTKVTESTYSGVGIKVAVLDTGIDKHHEAFEDGNVNLVLKNFTEDVDHDTDGHGTHCAGTIFGSPVDGTRIGVAPNVETAFIGKVIGSTGGSTANILSAINWAADQGANIISMSLGIDFPGYVNTLVERHGLNINAATSIALEGYRSNVLLYQTLSEHIFQKSKFINPCIIIAAAGNESNRPDYEIAVAPPAIADRIISVGAIDQNNKIASFSNTKPTLSGPGVNILSAKLGGGLVALNGTSMATPHVAGIAALWAESLGGSFSIEQLKAELLANCWSAFPEYNSKDHGVGVVQAPFSQNPS